MGVWGSRATPKTRSIRNWFPPRIRAMTRQVEPSGQAVENPGIKAKLNPGTRPRIAGTPRRRACRHRRPAPAADQCSGSSRPRHCRSHAVPQLAGARGVARASRQLVEQRLGVFHSQRLTPARTRLRTARGPSCTPERGNMSLSVEVDSLVQPSVFFTALRSSVCRAGVHR
jgi:hypothetical protein